VELVLRSNYTISVTRTCLSSFSSYAFVMRNNELSAVNTVFPGMRTDVVLNASQPVNSYWIRVQGLAQCAWRNVQQVAVLLYEGSNLAEPAHPPVKLPYIPQSKVTALRNGNVESCNLYSSTNIIRVIKPRRMRRGACRTHVSEEKCLQKLLPINREFSAVTGWITTGLCRNILVMCVLLKRPIFCDVYFSSLDQCDLRYLTNLNLSPL
jgi:hypothetical protein